MVRILLACVVLVLAVSSCTAVTTMCPAPERGHYFMVERDVGYFNDTTSTVYLVKWDEETGKLIKIRKVY